MDKRTARAQPPTLSNAAPEGEARVAQVAAKCVPTSARRRRGDPERTNAIATAQVHAEVKGLVTKERTEALGVAFGHLGCEGRTVRGCYATL